MSHIPNLAAKRGDLLHKWKVGDSAELYNVKGWGAGFFSLNNEGRLAVTPRGPEGPAVDLKALVDELRERGIDLPILIRFSDILRSRIDQLNEAFAKAIKENEYTAPFMGGVPD
jgi:arginine decarboxylase